MSCGSRFGRGWHFERELARALPADVVVAHMIPVYVLLAAPLVSCRARDEAPGRWRLMRESGGIAVIRM